MALQTASRDGQLRQRSEAATKSSDPDNSPAPTNAAASRTTAFTNQEQQPRREVLLRWPRNLLFLAVVLMASFACMYGVYCQLAAELQQEDSAMHVLKVPKTIEEVKEIRHTAIFLVEKNFGLMFWGYCALYLFKQTFVVPGSAALNMVSGMIWGVRLGWPLACVLSALGATLCSLLSKVCAEEMALRVGPDATGRFAKALWRVKSKIADIRAKEGQLAILLYLVSLRLFPGMPQWLLNLVLPHCGIGTPMFFVAFLIGLAPYNFVTVSAGDMIGSINSLSDVLTTGTLLKLCSFALFLPTCKYLYSLYAKEAV
ncbi:Transmembrane protein 41A-A [Durusdinium trenchii]|uniref:Transmembrane protein 41A-A n=1 Tax=Durusdinium trenchii TaxID=1381693 RepID=A0ABP0KM36_9DINO